MDKRLKKIIIAIVILILIAINISIFIKYNKKENIIEQNIIEIQEKIEEKSTLTGVD